MAIERKLCALGALLALLNGCAHPPMESGPPFQPYWYCDVPVDGWTDCQSSPAKYSQGELLGQCVVGVYRKRDGSTQFYLDNPKRKYHYHCNWASYDSGAVTTPLPIPTACLSKCACLANDDGVPVACMESPTPIPMTSPERERLWCEKKQDEAMLRYYRSGGKDKSGLVWCNL